MTQHPQGAISCQWGSIEVVCWPVHKHFIMITFLGHQGLLAWSRTIEHINHPPPRRCCCWTSTGSQTAAQRMVPLSDQPSHYMLQEFSSMAHFVTVLLGFFLWFVNICYYYKVTSTFTIHSVTYIYLLISDAANKVCRLDQKKNPKQLFHTTWQKQFHYNICLISQRNKRNPFNFSTTAWMKKEMRHNI